MQRQSKKLTITTTTSSSSSSSSPSSNNKNNNIINNINKPLPIIMNNMKNIISIRQLLILTVLLFVCLSIWFNINFVIVNLIQNQVDDVNLQLNNNNKRNIKKKKVAILKGNDFTFPSYPKLDNENKILDKPEDIEIWSSWAKQPLVGSFRIKNNNNNNNDNDNNDHHQEAYIHYPYVDLEYDYKQQQQVDNKSIKYAAESSSVANTEFFDQHSVVLTRRGMKFNTQDSTCGIGIKCNQDRVVLLKFNNKYSSSSPPPITHSQDDDDDWWIGLFDGHGTYGHVISQYTSYEFPKRLLLKASSSSSSSAPETTTTTPETIIHSIFDEIQNSMPQLPGTQLISGTTAISIWKHHNNLIISNLGDSTAFVTSYRYDDDDNKIVDIELVFESEHHKPNNPEERQRIESMGGSILEAYDFDSSARLIIPDTKGNPDWNSWIAMSRSLGNHDGAKFGMSCIPTTTVLDLSSTFDFNKSKKYLVVAASDGLMRNGVNWVSITHAFGMSFASTNNNNNNPTTLEVAEKLILQASGDSHISGRRDDISIAVHQLQI